MLLRYELKVVYETNDIRVKTGRCLQRNGVHTLVLIIPATFSSVERNFSTQTYKICSKKINGQKKRSFTSLLSIQNGSEHAGFYVDVIDEISKINRRIKLH